MTIREFTMKGLFITGTDTEVGKTYVTVLVGQMLKKEGIACRSEADYEKAVDIKKRNGLHNAAKFGLVPARAAFLGLLRINALGFASVLK